MEETSAACRPPAVQQSYFEYPERLSSEYCKAFSKQIKLHNTTVSFLFNGRIISSCTKMPLLPEWKVTPVYHLTETLYNFHDGKWQKGYS